MLALTNNLRVADLMTIDPIVIREDASIEDAEDLLHRNRISGLPVVDESGQLAGVVSQTDLLYLAVPRMQAIVRHHDRGVRVGEVMSSPPVTIPYEARLEDAARVMHDRQVHRLVAIDDRGRPVGVISAMDYVALAAEG